jgi:hypothetical protein
MRKRKIDTTAINQNIKRLRERLAFAGLIDPKTGAVLEVRDA